MICRICHPNWKANTSTIHQTNTKITRTTIQHLSNVLQTWTPENIQKDCLDAFLNLFHQSSCISRNVRPPWTPSWWILNRFGQIMLTTNHPNIATFWPKSLQTCQHHPTSLQPILWRTPTPQKRHTTTTIPNACAIPTQSLKNYFNMSKQVYTSERLYYSHAIIQTRYAISTWANTYGAGLSAATH